MRKTSKEIIQILMTLNDYYHIKSNYVIAGKAKTRDETIQFFSPGRAFELYDLVLDCSRSIIGGILILLLCK